MNSGYEQLPKFYYFLTPYGMAPFLLQFFIFSTDN